MIEASALKNQLVITEREPITSGSVNVYQVHFHFSSHWDGLEKVAIFQTPDTTINIPIENNLATIPWEVMTTPGYTIRLGIYGIKALEVILPTVWGSLGTVEQGVIIGDAETGEHTPDIYDTILAKVQEVNGKLDGINKTIEELRNEIPDDDELTAVVDRLIQESTKLPEVIEKYLQENPPQIPDTVLAQTINQYLEDNPIETLTEERVYEMINETVGSVLRSGY